MGPARARGRGNGLVRKVAIRIRGGGPCLCAQNLSLRAGGVRKWLWRREKKIWGFWIFGVRRAGGMGLRPASPHAGEAWGEAWVVLTGCLSAPEARRAG